MFNIEAYIPTGNRSEEKLTVVAQTPNIDLVSVELALEITYPQSKIVLHDVCKEQFGYHIDASIDGTPRQFFASTVQPKINPIPDECDY